MTYRLKGEYSHNLDSKNRLAVPAKFREQLPSELVAVDWMDGCISVYDEDRFDALLEKFENLSLADDDARRLVRKINRNALDVSIDAQGRILLNAKQLERLSFKKACVILGQRDHFEIWPEEVINSYDEDDRSLNELMKTQKDRI